ncbi:porin family protein [Allomuricauda sp. d1]|uniref:porin family protein n=1 Tax=Allomuricauda sp. d1 TaxID=3136725 RepID=UPI0031CFD7D3
MKRLLLVGAMLLLVCSICAQETPRFGLTGGLLNSNVDFDFTLGNISATNNTGFYIGGILDVPISEKLHFQPELTYGSAGDLGFIFLPAMLKFYAAESFHLQAGPQFSFSTTLNDIKNDVTGAVELIDDDFADTIESILRNFGVDIGFGAGYDINENFTIQARYSIELTNRYNGPGSGLLTLRAQQINVGVAYFFD